MGRVDEKIMKNGGRQGQRHRHKDRETFKGKREGLDDQQKIKDRRRYGVIVINT